MANTGTLHAAFLPLLDAAPLIVAADKGFAAAENIDLQLVREASWASVRDRMSVGHFDVAQLLAPMPVAAALGLSGVDPQVVAPMALGFGGNTVTISTRLANSIRQTSPAFTDLDAKPAGAALRAALDHWKQHTGTKPVFGVVHRFSSHNLDLRYWLAASGIEPDVDVDLRIVPPPLMPSCLVEGTIDGFCVGEPWGSVAVAEGAGHVLTTKASIWHNSPEKVLGVRKALVEQEPELVESLVRAVFKAARWCGAPENRSELLAILAVRNRLNVPQERLESGLTGQFEDLNGTTRTVPNFYNPSDNHANFPWQSHALWFYTQLARWGLAPWEPNAVDAVKAAYRPDIYRSALSDLPISLPETDMRIEGDNDRAIGFFDKRIFDASRLADAGTVPEK